MVAFTPEGIMTSLVTPFDADGVINWRVFDDLIERQVEAGVAAVVVTAGAGEYVTLRPDERVEIVRRAAERLRGRSGLVAAVLAPDTGAAIDAARAAEAAGAQALLLLTPFYVSPSPAGQVMHFQKVAEAVSLPIILYNNPGRTGTNLEAATLEQLVELPTVVAIKECDRDLGRVAFKMRRTGTRLTFLGGDDDLSLPIWSIGAKGGIMAATSFPPIAVAAVEGFAAFRHGDWGAARDFFEQRLLPFMALYRGPDHPGPLKQVLGQAGIPVGTGRPPLQPLGEERLAEIRRGLQELGLIDAASR